MAARRDPTKNVRLALTLAGVVVGMVGVSFAAVPLYDLFCRVTGFGGTTQVADALPEEAGQRSMTIRFNADVHPRLPWSFQPEKRKVDLKVGEQGMIYFHAKNLGDGRNVGTAVFNVTPLKAGQYFNKVQCFCFDEQALKPGEEAAMGVSFFVDPAINEDPNLDEVTTITLSYTFFRDLDDMDDAEGAQVSEFGSETEAEGASTVN